MRLQFASSQRQLRSFQLNQGTPQSKPSVEGDFQASSPRLASVFKAHYRPRFSGQTPNDRLKTVRDFATQYQPRVINGYTIHNAFFNPLTTLPDASAIDAIRSDLEQRGSFDVKTDPETGLVQTSDTVNQDMLRQWFTDSCMVGFLQRQVDPSHWRKSMITNAAALNSTAALQSFQNTAQDPNWYRQGGNMNGVFHIYLPQSVRLDKEGIPIADTIELDQSWFNQKRLESQALMLLNLVDTIRAGVLPEQQKPWGFSPEELDSKAGQYVTSAVANLIQYLMAVNTDPGQKKFNFETPSTGSWEEMPFKEGMTWDTAATILAAEHLYQLLYTDPQNPKLNEISLAIHHQAPQLSQKNLSAFIKAGRAFIDHRITHPLSKNQDPIQTPLRPYDSCLSILAASDYVFVPHSRLKDAAIRLALLVRNKAALLGENGMRRYNPFTLDGVTIHDSYLNSAYHFPEDLRRQALNLDQSGNGKHYGSTDASSLGDMQERQALSKPEYAAEWGLGLSASLQALAKSKIDVLTEIQRTGHASPTIMALLARIDSELLDFLNRNMAAIPGPLKPGEKIIRADGTEVKPYSPMEAYEVVPDNTGHMKRIPGAHTLPWHAAQLYDGLTRLAQAQQLQEALLPN